MIYAYALNEFSDGKVNAKTLHREINDNEIITAELDGVTVDIDDASCIIVFDTELNSTEKNELDNIIANHDGTIYPSSSALMTEYHEESSRAVSSTTDNKWTEKMRLSTSYLPEGRYRVAASFKISSESQFNIIRVRVRIENDKLMESNIRPTQGQTWYEVSGFDYWEGSGEQDIIMEFCSLIKGRQVNLRGANIEMWRAR